MSKYPKYRLIVCFFLFCLFLKEDENISSKVALLAVNIILCSQNMDSDALFCEVNANANRNKKLPIQRREACCVTVTLMMCGQGQPGGY